MTVWTLVSIVCDGCKRSGGYDDCRTAADARDNARSEGWSVARPGGRDICDECRRGKR